MTESFKDIFKSKKKDIKNVKNIEMCQIPDYKLMEKIKLIKTEDQIYCEINEDRNKRLTEINEDMLLLNALFLDVAKMVNSQGENVNIITDNVETAYYNAESGRDNIISAEKSSR